MEAKIRYETLPRKYAKYAAMTIRGAWRVTIIIDPKYAKDIGLLAHEMYHASGNWLQVQWKRIAYSFSDKAKYREEVNAYAVQYCANPPKMQTQFYVNKYAGFLQTLYSLPTAVTRGASVDLNRAIVTRLKNISNAK